jgi:hypothetical protein
MTTYTIERPEHTLSERYRNSKAGIYLWRSKNKERVKEYNREYQRKRRADPVMYAEIRNRTELRAYLTGRWVTSYKTITQLGATREQIAHKVGLTEKELINSLKTHEIDHILSKKWFDDKAHEHLRPFMYRHYNLQFVPKEKNRSKHCWVDESDPRVQKVIALLELEYTLSQDKFDSKQVRKLNSRISKLELLIKRAQNN